MRQFLIFIFILILFWVNNTFSANSIIGNLNYNETNSPTECTNQIRNNTSWVKYIPSTNNFTADAIANWFFCKSYWYYWWIWSTTIPKWTHYVCPNKWYASQLDDLWWTYRVYCKYRLTEENIELNSALFADFWVADASDNKIEISFPFDDNDLKANISKLTFTFVVKDNTSINWHTKSTGSLSDSAVDIQSTTTDFFSWDERTITYVLDNPGIINNFINWTNDWLIFKYNFFNPTKIAWTDTDWFIFKTIKYDIEFIDTGTITDFFVEDIITGININNSNIPIVLTPLYDINITWEIEEDWFLEWKTQTWTIRITKNSNSNSTSEEWLYFVQSGSTMNYFTWTWQIDTSIKKSIDISNTTIWTKFLSALTDGTSYVFKTLFRLTDPSWFIDDIKDIRLYEYLRYDVWWRTVTYLAWILNTNNTQNFETLKIYWITNIDTDKQRDLTENQDSEDIQNLAWEIIKSWLKRDIKKAAINTIKYVDTEDETASILNLAWNTWNDSDNWWKVLWDILYYDDLNGENVILWDWDELSITWKKTIIVIWWNLRITSNIVNTANSDILWIIVLKDEAGNWWKVYIDTTVLKVDAIIYADKSVISYNTSYDNWNGDIIKKYEADWNIDDDLMKNQLYILWTVFTENTIWGSRLLPPVCPFWTEAESIICDIVEAQKYDLSYLRVGVKNKYNNTYGDYPVIIKYNPNVQSWPPPLFSK